MAGIGIATSLRTSRMNVIKDAIDAGASYGKIRFYNNPIVTNPGDAISTQTLLAECLFSDPCGTTTNGVFTASAISDDASANADGTVSWARVLDSNNTFVMDITVGATGSGHPCTINNTSITSGSVVRVTQFILTDGNGTMSN